MFSFVTPLFCFCDLLDLLFAGLLLIVLCGLFVGFAVCYFGGFGY